MLKFKNWFFLSITKIVISYRLKSINLLAKSKKEEKVENKKLWTIPYAEHVKDKFENIQLSRFNISFLMFKTRRYVLTKLEFFFFEIKMLKREKYCKVFFSFNFRSFNFLCFFFVFKTWDLFQFEKSFHICSKNLLRVHAHTCSLLWGIKSERSKSYIMANKSLDSVVIYYCFVSLHS